MAARTILVLAASTRSLHLATARAASLASCCPRPHSIPSSGSGSGLEADRVDGEIVDSQSAFDVISREEFKRR